ncbi:MAG: gliding motility-associated C-terminal domain-containing protein [Bacteroidales bacterium]|nr:gliding motility-associated C-terminal domain-containing protein [Bacteroidales bacterium]
MFYSLSYIYRCFIFVCFFLLFLLFLSNLRAEGTKEITTTKSSYAKLMINNYYSPFALYDCATDFRLNIRISEIGEKIFFGFAISDATEDKDISFRIKDPQGKVVYASQKLPFIGDGFIMNYEQAVAGPDCINANGYKPFSYIPSMTGDFYIEFDKNCIFDFIDITVISADIKRINGRLWSKGWVFTLDNFSNKFYGTVFIYADDGIVTSVDFNGMQPFMFSIFSNKKGCYQNLPFVVSRKSQLGIFNYPQYKIFLNNPDSVCFPSGSLGNFSGPVKVTDCFTDSLVHNNKECNFYIPVNQDGNVELFLDLNDIEGYQSGSEDRVLTAEVKKGINIVYWDGKDGLGNLVLNHKKFKIIIKYYNGLTNLPLTDVEYNLDGIKVELVRPKGPKLALYWDDANINNGTVNLNGCYQPDACHTWDWDGNSTSEYAYGNENTINTWWYASSISVNLDFTYNYIEADANRHNKPGQSNDTALCKTSYLNLAGSVTNAKGAIWGGGQGYFNPSDKKLDAIYYFSDDELKKGKSAITLTTVGIGYCKAETDTMNITLFPLPKADAGENDSVCLGDSILIKSRAYNGTAPYNYIWSPVASSDSAIYVSPIFSTDYKLKIYDINGCKAMDNITIYVNPQPEYKLFYPDCLIPADEAFIKVKADSLTKDFIWQDGKNTNEYKVYTPDTYIVRMKNIYGCQKSDSVALKYCTFIWVPKSFTPNGDGLNDYFVVSGLEIHNYKINIFDRWGNVLFISDDINKYWDGKLNGQDCPQAVYGWIINYKEFNFNKTRKGYVTLIR